MSTIRSLVISIILVCLHLNLAFGGEMAQHLAPFAGKRAISDGDIRLWTNKEYVDRALARIKEAGFNVYMPTVWQGRGGSLAVDVSLGILNSQIVQSSTLILCELNPRSS